MVKNSLKQLNKNGRGRDKNGRMMHPNSLKNLRPNPEWKTGHSGNPQGQSITARQKEKMLEMCPFDGQARTWLEALAEGGMRMALNQPIALNSLQDRHEGKMTQPIEGSFEIKDAKELTDEQLAVIAATNIIENNATGCSRGTLKETESP